jgi:hypothetical protein
MSLFRCDVYWKTTNQSFNVVMSDGEWDGEEGAKDDLVFFYTEGSPVMGDHGEFVVLTAKEFV